MIAVYGAPSGLALGEGMRQAGAAPQLAAGDWIDGLGSWGGRGHALMIDWDAPPDWGRVRRLLRRYGLPPLHRWESSAGRYHGLALCERPADEIAALQAALGGDPRHTSAGRSRGFWVLRTGPEGARPAPRRLRTLAGAAYPSLPMAALPRVRYAEV